MIALAFEIGIAKPTFCALPGSAMAVLMPITRPCASTSGPPELPGLIAASVWMTSSNALAGVGPDLAVQARDDAARHGETALQRERVADGDDVVADLDVVGVAELDGRQAGGVDLDHREVARCVVPEDRGVARGAVGEHRLDLAVAPSTTWLLVTITPSDEITNPVPAAPPESGPPSSTIATTAGTSAFRICAMSPVRRDPVRRAHDHRGRGRARSWWSCRRRRRGTHRTRPERRRARPRARRRGRCAGPHRGRDPGGPAAPAAGARRPTPPPRAVLRSTPARSARSAVGRARPGLRPGGSPPRSAPPPARSASATAATERSASLGRRLVGGSVDVEVVPPEHATLASGLPRMVTKRTAAERPALPPSPRGAAVRWGVSGTGSSAGSAWCEHGGRKRRPRPPRTRIRGFRGPDGTRPTISVRLREPDSGPDR